MALHNAELENDMFYTKLLSVYRRGLVEVSETNHQLTGREVAEVWVCTTADEQDIAPEGSAEQIARALNRLPRAEMMLVEIAGAIRTGDETRLNQLADEIEDWMVNG